MSNEQIPYTLWLMNDVMPNELFGYEKFPIQEFLTQKKSFLADYKIGAEGGGEIYADWLDAKCHAANLNPKHILVTLQKEQSLIENAPVVPEQRKLDRALGFAMTDTGDQPQFYGFQRQHETAIKDITTDYVKYSKLSIQPKKTVDGNLLTIQPLNEFTSTLYEYTPWTGTRESIYFPKLGLHGVYLFWFLWKKYWPEDLGKYYHITEVEKYKRRGWLDAWFPKRS